MPVDINIGTDNKAKAAAQSAPPPSSAAEGERYLTALLETQQGMRSALRILAARAAIASADEARYIELKEGLIEADYLELDAMVAAYLSHSTIIRRITPAELGQIRSNIHRIQSLVAEINTAQQIVQAVTALLGTWQDEPGDADLGIAELIEITPDH